MNFASCTLEHEANLSFERELFKPSWPAGHVPAARRVRVRAEAVGAHHLQELLLADLPVPVVVELPDQLLEGVVRDETSPRAHAFSWKAGD